MTEEKYRFPRFAATRNDGRTLVEQVADVLRQAMATGFYRAGDVLPPMRSMCRAAGVSMIVMNEVMARLASEGLVNPRRGIGCLVLGRGERLWKGRVLFVVPESDGSYFINVLVGSVRESLMREGWLFHQVTLGGDERGAHDFSLLETAFRGTVDLVLTLWDRDDIRQKLADASVPFVIIDEKPCPGSGAAGRIAYQHRAFAPSLVEDCVAAGIRRVEQVGWMRSAFDAAPALRSAGIEVVETVIPPRRGYASMPLDVKQPVMDAFERRLAGGKARAGLPDLFYFDDDNVAEAALTSLAYHGVKIPRDVRVVSLSNAGMGPCFPVPLARVVMDPVDSGRTVARAALSYLSGNGIPADAVIKPFYVRGGSFPVPSAVSTRHRKEKENESDR